MPVVNPTLPVTIAACGDIFPANLHYTIGFGVASRFSDHRGVPWIAEARRCLPENDIAIGNLESPLTWDSAMSGSTCFTGGAPFARFLRQLGIGMVSVANNHILHRGREGFYTTLEILGRNGIRHIGRDSGGTSNVEVIPVRGRTVGFAAFSGVPDPRNNGIYARLSDRAVGEALAVMQSRRAEHRVISVHWGDEYTNIPSRDQIESAHRFVDMGADVIIGHHPHVIQPVERYRRGLIFYSMGNFLFDMVWSANVRRGMVASVVLNGRGEIRYSTVATFIGDSYGPSADDSTQLSEALEKYLARAERYRSGSWEQYERHYARVRATHSLYQRCMMKLFLLKNWRMVSPETRSLLRQRAATLLGGKAQ